MLLGRSRQSTIKFTLERLSKRKQSIKKLADKRQKLLDRKMDDASKATTKKISRSKKQLNRKLPITDWAPKYNVECFVSDLIAGITVALTVIPQGIAYALIAELPPQVSHLASNMIIKDYILY